jgi:hypothetical protein
MSADEIAAQPEYDYAGAFRLIEQGKPGADGCLGCFRCRAGDHDSCHGCSCPCAWRGSAASLRASFGSLIPANTCPEGCGNE